MTPAQTARMVAQLVAAFPRAEVGRETLAVYARCLQDLTVEEATLAAATAIAECRFFPSVAEVRGFAFRVPGELSGPEAWGSVMRAASRFGREREPEWDSPAVGSAVRAIGWRALCNGSETDPAARARFCEAYESARVRQKRSRTTGQLVAAISGKTKLLGGSE